MSGREGFLENGLGKLLSLIETVQKQINKLLRGSSFRGVEWMIRGAEKHHPLGLKQHLLENVVFFCVVLFFGKSQVDTMLINKKLYESCPAPKLCDGSRLKHGNISIWKKLGTLDT